MLEGHITADMPYEIRHPSQILQERRRTDWSWNVAYIVAGACLLLHWQILRAPRGLPLTQISRGFDFQGLLCGVDVPDKPFVYWPVDPQTNRVDSRVPICVERCPTKFDVFVKMALPHPRFKTSNSTSSSGAAIRVDVEYEQSPVYSTEAMWGEFCMPSASSTQFREVKGLVKTAGLDSAWILFPRGLATLEAHRLWLMGSAAVAGLVSMAAVWLVSKAPMVACWAFLAASPVAVLVAGARLLLLGTEILRATQVPRAAVAAEQLGSVVSLSVGALSCFLALAAVLRLAQHRRRVTTAIGALKAATECIRSAPQLLLIVGVGQLLLTFLALGGAAGLARIAAAAKGFGDEALGVDDGQWASIFGLVRQILGLVRQFRRSALAVVASLGWLWLVLWLCAVVECGTRLMVAFVATLWYFSMPDLHGKKEELPSTWRIAGRAFRFHSGSIALAATLLAPVEGLAAIANVASMAGQLACFCRPLLFFQPIRWLSAAVSWGRDAARTLADASFVECVLHSSEYWQGYKTAARRLRSGIGEAYTVHGVTRHFTHIVAVAVAVGVGLCAFDLSSAVGTRRTVWTFESPLALALCVAFLAYMVAKLSLACTDEVADVLFYCFIIEAKGPFGIVFAPESVPALIEHEVEVMFLG